MAATEDLPEPISEMDKLRDAIAHTQKALEICDGLGLASSAIDLSSALDKLASHTPD